MSDVLIAVPARYGSSRLPGKILKKLAGKPVIQHVYEQCLKAGVGDVLIATESPLVVEACAQFGAKAILTSETCQSGTDRIYEAAQGRDDVVFVHSEAEKDEALRRFKARGVADVVVTAHVRGDVVKFYGVLGTGFFRTFHADEGYSKFGDEAVNGAARHYHFDAQRLRGDAERLAGLTGVDVFGGDCIVREDGTYAIIDFNDWPSFARCRAEAAGAIAARVEVIFKGKKVKR